MVLQRGGSRKTIFGGGKYSCTKKIRKSPFSVLASYKQKRAWNARVFPHWGLGRPKKVPSATLDVFSRSFLPWSFQIEKMRNFIFCNGFLFSDRKQKTRTPIFFFGTAIVKKFEILVFICANAQNRPAPSLDPNSRSWALLLSSPLGDGQNQAIFGCGLVHVHHWEKLKRT